MFKFLECPYCRGDMVEMESVEGVGVICGECGASLPAHKRAEPHTHITQAEVDRHMAIPKTYDYGKETLLL